MPTVDKRCTKCGAVKPLSEFSLSRRATATTKAVYRSECKPCCSARAMKWFADNKDRTDENRRRWHIKKRYGISIEEFDAILAQQGGVCAICGQDEPDAHGRTGTKFKLSIDHCHDSNEIRGILCNRCNRAIGLLNDDVDLLKKAIEYLERK
jgi:hypothetical protein